MNKAIHAFLLAGLMTLPMLPSATAALAAGGGGQSPAKAEKQLDKLDAKIAKLEAKDAAIDAKLDSGDLKPKQEARLQAKDARLDAQLDIVSQVQATLLSVICSDPALALSVPSCGGGGW